MRRVAEKAGSYEIVAEVANPMQLKLPFPGDLDLGVKVRKKYLALLEKLPVIKKHEDLRDLFPDTRYRKRILRSLDSYCPRKGDGWTLKIGTKQDAPYFQLTPESRNMIVKALQEPQVEKLTVTGELVRLHLDENRLGIYYEPTHKVLDCFYDEELEDFVINNLRGLIQVTGQVQLDENGEPAKIVHVSEIQELDLSPLQLVQVSTPKVTLQAIRPMEVVPGFWAFVPDPFPPNIDWNSNLVTALSAADRAVGELAGLGRNLPNPHLLINPFIRREAVLSSRIEGTRASLSDIYAYEVGQLRFWEDLDTEDVREVVNYIRALKYGLQRMNDLPLSLRLMRELHGILMEGVRGSSRVPGEFRRVQNWIGPPGCSAAEAHFVPPPVSEMHQALDKLERFLHDEQGLPPLIKAALAHYQFEAIHPFLDGNGRMGRMLIILLLCNWGILPQPLLYLSAYFAMYRDTYYECLQSVSTRGDWNKWLLFFLQGVESQARDAILRFNHELLLS